MKFICIARNYHKETRPIRQWMDEGGLREPEVDDPIIFMKHENAMLSGDKPFVYE